MLSRHLWCGFLCPAPPINHGPNCPSPSSPSTASSQRHSRVSSVQQAPICVSWPKRGRKHRPGGVSSISSYPVTMQAPHVQDPSPRAHCPSLTSHTCTHTTAFVTYKRRTFPVCGPGHPNISKSPGPGGPLPCGKRTLGSVGLTQLSFSLSLLFIPPLNFFLNLSLHHSLSLSASLAISLLQCLSHHLSLSQSLLIDH